MENKYTVVVKQEGEWWIGWVEEVPGVNCQEHTREALLVSLKAALKEALDFNKQEARSSAGMGFQEVVIAV